MSKQRRTHHFSITLSGDVEAATPSLAAAKASTLVVRAMGEAVHGVLEGEIVTDYGIVNWEMTLEPVKQ